MRRWVVRYLILVLGVAGFFAGLFFLSRWALDGLRGQDRYQAAVTDIVCSAPPGLNAQEFLEEVQYLSQLPRHFSVLEEGVEAKLARAFALHPWVEKVDQVVLKPPRTVRVDLTLRRPVLAVQVGDQVRVVDGLGVLLPKTAPSENLPLFGGKAKAPQGPAGSKWGDPNVEQRARDLATKKSTSPE